MYKFARASATKYHKLGVLKQQKYIVPQFWSLGDKINMATIAMFSLGLWIESSLATF